MIFLLQSYPDVKQSWLKTNQRHPETLNWFQFIPNSLLKTQKDSMFDVTRKNQSTSRNPRGSRNLILHLKSASVRANETQTLPSVQYWKNKLNDFITIVCNSIWITPPPASYYLKLNKKNVMNPKTHLNHWNINSWIVLMSVFHTDFFFLNQFCITKNFNSSRSTCTHIY